MKQRLASSFKCRIALMALLIQALAFLAAPVAVAAQQAGKPFRIALVHYPSRPTPLMIAGFETFRDGMRQRGWIEGKNLVTEMRLTESHQSMPGLVAQVVRESVDLIVVVTTPAALAAKGVTTTIPIVMTAACDPVDCGVVDGLARPGGNMTGSTIITADIAGKRIEFLKEIAPGLRRIAGIPYMSDTFCATAVWLTQTEATARVLDMTFRKITLETLIGSDRDAAFAALKKDGVGAIAVMEGPPNVVATPQIVAAALKHGMATVFPFREQVAAGGLLSYGPNLITLFQRTAHFADRILRGAKPGDLPIEQPTKFELLINEKTAKALGLTIPRTLLLQADEVIR